MNRRPAQAAGYCVSVWLAFGAGPPAIAATSPEPVIHPQRWPELPAALPRDEVLEARVEELMARMTPEQKVGQLIQADIGSITPNDLHQYPLGSILNGGNSAPGDDKLTAPSEWLALADRFYEASVGGPGAAPVPALWGTDAVHGHNNIPGATIFPHNIGLGAARDPELIRRIGEITALEVRVTGLDWAFSPTVAVSRDARWGRTYESYSENPEVVRQYAVAMVLGLQGTPGTPEFLDAAHVLATPKHFLGDGGTGGKDQGDNLYTEKQLLELDSLGYQAAILAGAQTIMASYSSWHGQKMHGNHALLTEVLKGRFGFEGLVIGDWNGHAQLPGCSAGDCPAALNAGVDMLMAPDGWKELYRNTLEQVRSGEIPAARVDDAVRRILRVKVLAGAFERAAGGADPRRDSSVAGHFELLGGAAHRALAREAVRKSLVLLKNARGTLPLNPHANILVAGSAADDIGMQCGGWTIDWQGDHNTQRDFPGATSVYAGIRAAVTAAGGTVTLSRDGHFRRRPDAAILVYGESPYAEFEGDRETLVYAPRGGELGVLRRLRAQHIPVVSVFLSGRPLWVNPELNASDAFVAAWLPGSEGEGIADLLFRSVGGASVDFTGRLAFSWPATGMPVSFDAADGVSGALFARGFGLDYTQAGKVSTGSADVPPLSEDPKLPLRWQAPPGSLFHAGHATAPWSAFIADEAEVHATLPTQKSPHGVVTVSPDPAGVAVTWNGLQPGRFTLSGPASDLRRAAARGDALRLKFRIDQPPDRAVRLGMECSKPGCGAVRGAFIDVSAALRAAPGEWQDLSVPLACLRAGRRELADVPAPFALETAGVLGVTLVEVSLGKPHGIIPPSCR